MELTMKITIILVNMLTLVIMVVASVRANAERNTVSAPRAPVTASGGQSWTVYAPSGRPVTMRQEESGRWWPSR
jgi:hypothetical protein